MYKVKLTIVKSNCRCNYLKSGEEFIVGDLCPPICHELWNSMYPFVKTNIKVTANHIIKKDRIPCFCWQAEREHASTQIRILPST